MSDKDALIAELRARIAELEQSEERFRTICENAPVMIDSFDAEGRCLLWNRECVDRLGYTKEDLDASGDPLALSYPDPQVRAQVLEAIRRADGTFREYRVRAKDCSERIQEWADFRLPTGALISVGRDVTEQRTVEQQLRHAQKLDGLGQLSAGIAHDFNNLLTVVMSNSELLLRRRALSEGDAELVQLTKAAAQRGADLVRKLLAFSRGEMLELRAVDVRAQLEDLVPTLRRLLPETIEVVLDAPDDLPLLRADPGALEQMLVNLATNARDALPGGGRIVLGARRVGEEVLVSVRDDGVGMAPDVRERALEPFFTTKSEGRSSGLGLAIVRGFMTQHGGRIHVRSGANEGTTVELCFPRADERSLVATRAPGEAEIEGARARERVLVVEDELAIRNATCAVLSELGYRVVSAGDGQEALDVLAETTVDLIVSDVVMPNLTGPQLRAALDPATRPPFLFLTGYSSGQAKAQTGLSDERHVLHKPWTVNQLALAVRKVLDGGE